MFELHDSDGTKHTVAAHRWAWEQKNGPIPPDTCIRHVVCSTPACTNVRHMALGSKADNSADMVRQNRQSRYADRKPKVPCSQEEKSSFLERFRAGETVYAVARDSGRDYVTVRNSIRKSLRQEQEAQAELESQLRTAPLPTPTPTDGVAQYLEAA
jgi:HNH endonuclease